jgi:hypothetical protein
MVYDHAGRTAVLEALNPEAHPMHYDLCPHHADHLRVPVGWALEDRRARRLAVAS